MSKPWVLKSKKKIWMLDSSYYSAGKKPRAEYVFVIKWEDFR